MITEITCKSILTVDWREGNFFALNGGVDIWQTGIDEHEVLLPHYTTLLSPDEHARAGRYHHQKDKDRFIISRAVLRILLGRYLKLPAVSIVFTVGDNKKPYVNNVNGVALHYNTSHSGNMVLIAVSAEPVGIDVENVEQNFQYTDILEHSFNPHQIEQIHTAPVPIEMFYTYWTRKEALLKATGKGIDDDMKLLPCTDGLHTVESKFTGSKQNWRVGTFPISEDYLGSLAHTGGEVSFYRFTK